MILLNINIIKNLCKYLNSTTIYNLSLINQYYYHIIRNYYFHYSLAYDNYHNNQKQYFTDVYPSINQLLTNESHNLDENDAVKIYYCVKKQFTEKDIIELFDYDNTINFTFLNRMYYIITPYFFYIYDYNKF